MFTSLAISLRHPLVVLVVSFLCPFVVLPPALVPGGESFGILLLFSTNFVVVVTFRDLSSLHSFLRSGGHICMELSGFVRGVFVQF
jgi:hypothetical protein